MYFGNTYFDGQNRGKDFQVLLREKLQSPGLIVDQQTDIIWVFWIEDGVDDVEDQGDQAEVERTGTEQTKQILGMKRKMDAVREAVGKVQQPPQHSPAV
jgi:hypothetical protein